MGLCGRPTQAGGQCQWPAETCPHHSARGRALARARARAFAAKPEAETGAGRERPPLTPPPAATFRRRDLRSLGWWAIGELIGGALEERTGTVLASLMRTLAALGPEPLATEEALREVELRGLLMQGLPPRTPGEWELAARLFSAEAVAEIARWRPSGEDHAGHDLEPLLLRDRAADEVEVAPVGEHEQRGLGDVGEGETD